MITMELMSGSSVAEQQVEIVERKGKGHPDTICDSVMDAISVALCRAYVEECGMVLHHNIDKGLLAAGRAEVRFGGGTILQPMELLIGDRATFSVAGKSIPVADIAVETAKLWFRQNMPHVDPERHLAFRVLLAPGSEELTGIFGRPGESAVANDTSAAVGFYPLSGTEGAVLALEQLLNGAEFKLRFPETGEDVKVMGLRRGRHLDVTVAMPLLAENIRNEQEYFSRKEAVRREMVSFLERTAPFDVGVRYNALDRQGEGLRGVYLSLLGTSAENADSGQVGRGNRVNGLISVNRPLGTEAAAGKNPVSHVGKIYNILAHRLARLIHEEVEGIREVQVLLLSRIGHPVNRPLTTSVRILPERRQTVAFIERQVEDVCERELARLHELCMELARGEHPVC